VAGIVVKGLGRYGVRTYNLSFEGLNPDAHPLRRHSLVRALNDKRMYLYPLFLTSA
jgi:hypothetical protein